MSEKTNKQVFAELQMFAGSIPKTEYNKHSKYYYRSAEGILKEMKGELKKAGCSIVITEKLIPFSDIESIVNAHKNIITTKGRMFVESTATLYRDAEVIASANAFAEIGTTRTGMDNPQNTGTSGSYAKKYALQNLFAIADGADDPDSHPPEKTPQKKKQQNSSVQKPDPLHPEDARDIKEKLAKATDLVLLEDVYNGLSSILQSNATVKSLFTARKNEIKGVKK